MHNKSKSIWQQIGMQAFLLLVTMSVLFPILWIFSLALDPRNIDKPLTLTLIPPGASLDSFKRVKIQIPPQHV
jgi:arabinogalactan oligomer/maltooligosaccharide transport system permease protein